MLCKLSPCSVLCTGHACSCSNLTDDAHHVQQVVTDADPKVRKVKEAWNAYVRKHRITAEHEIDGRFLHPHKHQHAPSQSACSDRGSGVVRGLESVLYLSESSACVEGPEMGGQTREVQPGQAGTHIHNFVRSCKDMAQQDNGVRQAILEHLLVLHSHRLLKSNTTIISCMSLLDGQA